MLTFLAVLIIVIVAYAQTREGLFSALTMFVNVIVAGIVTFNFWEPVTDELDVIFAGGLLAGYEDTFVLTVLFTMSLILLRVVTNKLVPQQIAFPGYLQQAGGGLFGLLTGYLVAGFLVCVLETLPWHENFLSFRPRADGETALRKYLPPDRAWLALMRHAGARSLAWKEDRAAENPYDRYLTFDSAGTFELRYLRYRRHGDKREPLRYEGELDRELRKEKPR
jgi:hypothetical protein